MHEREVKSILSSDNNMNLYRGCTHGCIYCDARSLCYQIQHEFTDIEVKSNALPLLEAALRRKRQPCMINTGSMSDPYLPEEETLRHTRQALELILRYGCGLSILTKSDRILRDLDLLQEIHRRSKCVVQLTLTTHDDNLCRIVEPNVCPTSRRVEVLEILRDAGVPTVVWMTPILPYLNETEENLRGILASCIRAKVYGIINFGMGMTLRDGNREYYYAQLDRHFPGLSDRYRREYGTRYELTSPNHPRLMPLFHRICREHGIEDNPDRIFAYLHAYPEPGEQLSLF